MPFPRILAINNSKQPQLNGNKTEQREKWIHAFAKDISDK